MSGEAWKKRKIAKPYFFHGITKGHFPPKYKTCAKFTNSYHFSTNFSEIIKMLSDFSTCGKIKFYEKPFEFSTFFRFSNQTIAFFVEKHVESVGMWIIAFYQIPFLFHFGNNVKSDERIVFFPVFATKQTFLISQPTLPRKGLRLLPFSCHQHPGMIS